MSALQDETFERELFAAREAALPAARLDMGDVLARARRLEKPRASGPRAAFARTAAWVGGAACAAASFFAVVRGGTGATEHRASAVMAHTSSRADDGAEAMSAAGARAWDLEGAKSTLACERELASWSASRSTSTSTSSASTGPRQPEPIASLHSVAPAVCDAHEGRQLVCDESVTISTAGP